MYIVIIVSQHVTQKEQSIFHIYEGYHGYYSINVMKIRDHTMKVRGVRPINVPKF